MVLWGLGLEPAKQNDRSRIRIEKLETNSGRQPQRGQDSCFYHWYWWYWVRHVLSIANFQNCQEPSLYPQLTVCPPRKTATLLEIAHQNSDERNIFFIHAHDAASLHQAYLHIAKCIGPEYLLKEFRGQDLQGIWSNESPEDKVGKFKVWLKDPENANALFLLDDMDGIQLLEHREAAFPDEAKTIHTRLATQYSIRTVSDQSIKFDCLPWMKMWVINMLTRVEIWPPVGHSQIDGKCAITRTRWLWQECGFVRSSDFDWNSQSCSGTPTRSLKCCEIYNQG